MYTNYLAEQIYHCIKWRQLQFLMNKMDFEEDSNGFRMFECIKWTYGVMITCSQWYPLAWTDKNGSKSCQLTSKWTVIIISVAVVAVSSIKSLNKKSCAWSQLEQRTLIDCSSRAHISTIPFKSKNRNCTKIDFRFVFCLNGIRKI